MIKSEMRDKAVKETNAKYARAFHASMNKGWTYKVYIGTPINPIHYAISTQVRENER
jgi:hypothetical protein